LRKLHGGNGTLKKGDVAGNGHGRKDTLSRRAMAESKHRGNGTLKKRQKGNLKGMAMEKGDIEEKGM